MECQYLAYCCGSEFNNRYKNSEKDNDTGGTDTFTAYCCCCDCTRMQPTIVKDSCGNIFKLLKIHKNKNKNKDWSLLGIRNID